MNYFIRETINGDPNAGSKARNDVSEILREAGWSPITLNFVYNEKLADKSKDGFVKKVRDNLFLRLEWEKQLKRIKKGDVVIVQFPVLRRPVLLAKAFSKVRKRGGRIVLLVHDLEILRYVQRSNVRSLKKTRITYEERTVMELADRIIVHNDKMKKVLKNMGFQDDRLIGLEIFDYLIPGFKQKDVKQERKDSVAIAGTLRPHKTQYLLHLPKNVSFELYGIGYEDQGMSNVHYHGVFPPDTLPMEMEASFGLVWDGDSAETCSGTYGEYLRINNPHKTSLYLASGIPVIIWKEAALASFIEKNNCGLLINSLDEIGSKLKELTDEELKLMKENTNKIAEMLRSGYFTKRAADNL